MSLLKELENIRKSFLSEVDETKTSKEVENLKVKYLGKKGIVSSLMPLLKEAKEDERPLLGQAINELKELVTRFLDERLYVLESKETENQLLKEWIDVTLPVETHPIGKYHPLTELKNQMVNILKGMGFSIEISPELDSDFYNFEALNFSKDHPARDMQDTFYVTADLLLRTHTTNAQVRTFEKKTPPIRSVVTGRVYRNESVSSRSHVFFHQLDAFYVDKHVSFADLLATLDEFWEKLFQRKVETRYRPSFFPFVEPGMEGDISCMICEGKGCRVCKHSGWLEVIGAGMIHPEVLKAGGLDPEVYSGYAWGMGLDRLAMLFHGINDIRLFTENDFRFLKQF